MTNEELAKEITHQLIKDGHMRDSAFTAVSRLIKGRLDNAKQARLKVIIRDMVEAYDSGNVRMESPEIGEPGDEPHPWHEEWMHYAKAAIHSNAQ